MRLKSKLQVRLRTILAIVLVFSVVLSLFSWHLQFKRRRLDAIQRLEAMGTYPSDYDDSPDVGMWPWIDKLLPMELNRQVTSLYILGDTDYSRLPVDELVLFPELNTLIINGDGFPTRLFRELPSMPNLEALSLMGSNVDDTGLCHLLANARGIRFLEVKSTSISDASVPCIQRCLELRDVYVSHSHFTPAGVKALATGSAIESVHALGIDGMEFEMRNTEALNSVVIWK